MNDGGFDVIVGNPPYVRIQTLPKDEVAFYNDHYAAATSNYDIYVLFVERALQLLKPGGVMGFILPKKFMQTTYGEGLRKLLAEQKAVLKIIDFGDAQVFDEVTTYTCLLFLRKQVNEKLTHVQAGDWLKAQEIVPRTIPDGLPEYQHKEDLLSESEWRLGVNIVGSVFERLGQLRTPLGEIAKLFVGLQTSADRIYIVEERPGSSKRLASVFSRSTGKVYRLEKDVVVPLLKGALDMRRYRVEAITRYVIFPYRDGALIPAKEFAVRFPNCWTYLKENRKVLAQREYGKLSDAAWYGYVYPKNLKLFKEPRF